MRAYQRTALSALLASSFRAVGAFQLPSHRGVRVVQQRPSHVVESNTRLFSTVDKSKEEISSSSSSSSSSNNDSTANTTATNNSATTNSNNSNTKHHLHTHQSILHNIHPHQLYQIINNVNEYQNFLPYCHESKILQRSNCGSMYDAVLGVGLPFSLPSIPILSLGRKDNGGTKKSSLLEERYVSRVRMIAPSNYDTTAHDTTDNIMEGKEEEGVMMWSVEAKSIQSQLFDSLKSRWQLTLLNNNNNSSSTRDDDDDDDDNNSAKRHGNFNCGVHFEVEIGVSNPLISLTLDSVLEDVARRQVEAFESRCHEVPLFRQ
mmetsp:Transcript_30421/g.56159  ORF Transcript_30421/g.56159 Transcript_30421/m.56159 type:complete len:318 (-) Transcript_30421:136-1089(-)